MTTPTDTAKLADDIEALAKKAASPPWMAHLVDEDRDDLLSEDATDPVACYVDKWDGALIVTLVNNHATIIAALRELEALKAENAKLREALEPFAAVNAGWPKHTEPESFLRIHVLPPEEGDRFIQPLRYKYFIAARAALGGAG